jgi:hypothetical protein
MEAEKVTLVLKIMVLMGIVFCAVAHFLPWGEISVGGLWKIEFYHWGGQMISDYSTSPPTSELHFTPTNFSGLTGSPKLYGYAAITLLLYFIIPASILSLLFGIVAYKQIPQKKSKHFFYAGSLALVSLIIFFIFIEVGILGSLPEGMSSLYTWSYGFYLIVISMILFLGAGFIVIKLGQVGQDAFFHKKNLSS